MADAGAQHFRRFLEENGLDRSIYGPSSDDPEDECGAGPEHHRFVRINPFAADALDLEQLPAAIGLDPADVSPLPWLPESFAFCSLPKSVNLSSCQAYRDAKLYGMDVASGAAVAALGVQPGHSVLDLCCAPGAKFCLLADAMQRRGCLVGVDASRERLAVSRRLLGKYHVERGEGWRCRLLCADGGAFDLGPSEEASPGDVIFDSASAAAEANGKRVRMNKSARAREAKRLRSFAAEALGGGGGVPLTKQLYDRVLVDAQCTHDGSPRHMVKLLAAPAADSDRRLFEAFAPERLAELEELQRKLIGNGFRLLQPGGAMVYATCSLARRQNEAIVSWLLEQQGGVARLAPTGLESPPCSPGALPHTLRFEPSQGTSGLFIARIEKAAPSREAEAGVKRILGAVQSED